MKTNIDIAQTFKLIALYIAVGVVAGVGAIVFQQFLSLMNIYLMEGLVGYKDISIVTGVRRFSLPWTAPRLRMWLFPLLTGSGGLITGLIVYKFAPEAAGHGTDEVIDAYHHKGGEVRLRVSIVKLLCSAVTIGSGGSGGKEGPIAQIGAGFGSFICGKIPSFRQYRREIMLAGMAAGIAAIFRAPLAGAILAAEILHSDMEYDGRVLIPAVLASVISYGVYALYFGFQPVFTVPEFTYQFALRHLFSFTLIGLISAFCAFAFVRVFYGIRDAFERLPVKPFVKPAIGGVLVGLVGMFVPEALGEGSFHLQRIVSGEMVISLLVAVLLLKTLTTSFSIASGGSGGVFGPSLFIGASLGGVFAVTYAALFPASEIPAVVFVLLGMVAFFSGAANAPISTVIIISEMTGVFTLIVPFLWVSMFGYIFSQKWDIYEKQVPSKGNVLDADE